VGYAVAASESMKGTVEGLIHQLQENGSFTQYPFRPDHTTGLTFCTMLVKHVKAEDFLNIMDVTLAGGLESSIFHFKGSNDESATFSLASIRVGTEYALGTPRDLVNVFGRVGVNASIIEGRLTFRDSLLSNDVLGINFHNAIRAGFHAEIGGRFNIPGSKFSIEATATYFNSNLIVRNADYLMSRDDFSDDIFTELNDGDDPVDTTDASKTIDYIALRLGLLIPI
jgi:hypothetical protein